MRMHSCCLTRSGSLSRSPSLSLSLVHTDVVGGFAQGKWLSSVEVYDPKSDSWDELKDLPSTIAAPGLAVC